VPDYSAETTFNVALDEELLDLLRDSGCKTLIIGFESISESTLLSMDKKVNFCLPYNEGLKRIQSRDIAVMANFIVGFDTDTLSVFEDTLKFIDENLIVYPFFSILTPMPGTKLHEEYKAEGRLDHFDWSRYDTRHVVMQPKHMTREQLMDGYCYLYQEAYGSERALKRLEKNWQTYPHHASTAVERMYLSLKLQTSGSWTKGTPHFQKFLKDAWAFTKKCEGGADLGELLYYFDSAHFADYLRRFRSADWEKHCELFKNPPQVDQAEVAAVPQKNAAPELVQLGKKQWESARSQRRVG
jgi:hypothetical protein